MCRQTDRREVERMVSMALQSYVEAENIFSAYDITRVVREARPDLEIPHREVRRAVHLYMSGVVQCGLYAASLREFDDDFAIVYEPAGRVIIPQVPFLSLN